MKFHLFVPLAAYAILAGSSVAAATTEVTIRPPALSAAERGRPAQKTYVLASDSGEALYLDVVYASDGSRTNIAFRDPRGLKPRADSCDLVVMRSFGFTGPDGHRLVITLFASGGKAFWKIEPNLVRRPGTEVRRTFRLPSDAGAVEIDAVVVP